MRMEESVGIEKNFVDVELPVDLSLEVADNRILKVWPWIKEIKKRTGCSCNERYPASN